MRRKIHIRQTDSYDCGAASLAAVAAWWGVKLPLERFRRECGCSPDGITLRGLADGAAAIGLNAKPMKAEGFEKLNIGGKISLLRNLKEATGPVIIHTVSREGLLHYMVIYKVGRKSVEVMDPARERIGRVNIADLAGRWSGYVILAGPGEGYREEDRTSGRKLRLLRLLDMHRREIILALAGSIVLSAMGICNSLLMQMLIDKAIPEGNLSWLIALAAVIVAMIPLSLAIGYLRDLYLLKGGLSIDNSLIIGFMRRILRMDERFFRDYSKGELESRLSDTVKTVLSVSAVIILNQFVIDRKSYMIEPPGCDGLIIFFLNKVVITLSSMITLGKPASQINPVNISLEFSHTIFLFCQKRFSLPHNYIKEPLSTANKKKIKKSVKKMLSLTCVIM